ncbi:MAG: hypothetical protein GQ474_01915, partial [Sulfurimonas sp.]|nr:hypothetical protein [Sulfurimonas sp.]
ESIAYASPLLADVKYNNLFYAIAHKEYTIYYVKDDELYFIKEIPKEDISTKQALIVDGKLYLFPILSSSDVDIINIPMKEIKNYNFKLVKQLQQAEKFYFAGFKEKAFSEYKKALKDKDFDKFFKPLKNRTGLIAIDAFVDLERYRATKDTKYLESYIVNALESKYLKEAKKALNALKKSPIKDAQKYLILDSAYLAEIGKEKEAYKALVNAMPFSKESVDMVVGVGKTSMKLYRDKGKMALVFDRKRSDFVYKKLPYSGFVSFEGSYINGNNKSASKSKKKVSKKSEAIELLD